jgi:glycosyltransferase involved in cell wall biosynthesis|tara:strand:+ start:21385 stop:22164 length:780 start_codon:yes stop_codon:yes gene_type:complete
LKNLKVSILIANYNNQYYLEECIKSIKSQTYKNIEVIFHDDFSSDESLIKASKFKNLKIIKNKKRGKFGSFNQMNAYQRAFNKSTGEIIFFLDSDDFFKKNKVKDTVNEFLKNNKISAIFDLPIIKYEKKMKFAKNKKKLLDNYWPYIPPQSCISIRRKHFKKMMNKINFNLFPDIWMDFRIALYLKYISKNFFILNNNLTFYRQSPKMVSSNFKFLSTSWLKRRMQAHNYVKYFYLKNKINYKKNLDYFITAFVNLFI